MADLQQLKVAKLKDISLLGRSYVYETRKENHSFEHGRNAKLWCKSAIIDFAQKIWSCYCHLSNLLNMVVL